MMWGVADFALLALIQIITPQSPQINAARWAACGCFALVVPWLAVLGFVVHDHMDPKRPPTIQQTINMHVAIQLVSRREGATPSGQFAARFS